MRKSLIICFFALFVAIIADSNATEQLFPYYIDVTIKIHLNGQLKEETGLALELEEGLASFLQRVSQDFHIGDESVEGSSVCVEFAAKDENSIRKYRAMIEKDLTLSKATAIIQDVNRNRDQLTCYYRRRPGAHQAIILIKYNNRNGTEPMWEKQRGRWLHTMENDTQYRRQKSETVRVMVRQVEQGSNFKTKFAYFLSSATMVQRFRSSDNDDVRSTYSNMAHQIWESVETTTKKCNYTVNTTLQCYYNESRICVRNISRIRVPIDGVREDDTEYVCKEKDDTHRLPCFNSSDCDKLCDDQLQHAGCSVKCGPGTKVATGSLHDRNCKLPCNLQDCNILGSVGIAFMVIGVICVVIGGVGVGAVGYLIYTQMREIATSSIAVNERKKETIAVDERKKETVVIKMGKNAAENGPIKKKKGGKKKHDVVQKKI